MVTPEEAHATDGLELIEAVGKLLFATRTGELPSVWAQVPQSTRERYLGEAGVLEAAGLLKDVP